MSHLPEKRWKFRLLLPLAVIVAIVLWTWPPWQRPIVIRESINPTDGAAMVRVPAGIP
jgi:hypothetical protein